MKLSAFGREVRKLRIDAGLLLATMADALGKSPSYLSSVETGRKPAGDDLVEATIKFFAKHGHDASVLRSAAKQDKKEVSIDQLHAEERNLMFALARMFPDSKSPADRERNLVRIQEALNEIEKELA